MSRKKLSIVIPAFNEERNVPRLFEALDKALRGVDMDAEIILVDDGSADGTLAAIERLAAMDRRVLPLSLSRNFGKEIATTAGIHAATGDAVLLMDADLQHPPAMIAEFVRRWQGGAEVVVGVRAATQGLGWFRRACSNMYYRLINAMSDTSVTPHATDFRLLDRVVVDEFNRFTERQRMTRALIDWLGFRRAYVSFDAPARIDGESRYGYWKLVRLALESFVAHSLFPLRVAGYLGICITIVSGGLGLFIFVQKYLLDDAGGYAFSGPAILAVIILFLVGIVLCCLGLMALYIANIHGEVVGRPLYALRRRAGGAGAGTGALNEPR